MNTFTQKDPPSHRLATATNHAVKESDHSSPAHFTNDHPAATAQRALAESLNGSPAVQSQLQLRQATNDSPRVAALGKLAAIISGRGITPRPQQPVQRQALSEGEELTQRQESAEEEPFQAKDQLLQKRQTLPVQKQENRTGLPENLKAGVEHLSGLSLDDVRVHYNSSQPAQLQALAYTRGAAIHVAPGQEQHVPHEAWHVVQQKQGRVQSTTSAAGAAINDDPALESEAGVMGEKVLQTRRAPQTTGGSALPTGSPHGTPGVSTGAVIQRMPMDTFERLVSERFRGLERQFVTFFEKEYLNEEARGGFDESGVMYGWDWRQYVEDNAFDEDILENYFSDFADVATKMLDVQTVSTQTLAGSIERAGTHVAGGREMTSESVALDLYKEMIAAVGPRMEEGESDAARDIIGKRYSQRTLEVVLNSIPDQVRATGQCRDFVDLISRLLPRSYWQSFPQSKPLVETLTRVGFEIEPGGNFIVNPKYFKRAQSLINETLASTDLLEFIIDDFKEGKDKGMVQIEFRTKPLRKENLQPALRVEIDKSIAKFPVLAFTGKAEDYGALVTKLDTAGWTASPKLESIAPGLIPLQKGRLTASGKRIQHITHSVPLASFVKLSKQDKDLLLPGSGGANNIIDLLLFFFKKANALTKGQTIEVTTKGRNVNAPNMKTALDTIIGLLNPADARSILAALSQKQRPTHVNVAGSVGEIQPPTIFDELPQFPRYNPEEGRGYLAAEEKLKPALFDPPRRDVRVLVEHRADALVDAVNDVMGGRDAKELNRYLDAFQRLDDVKGDDVFARWFQ